MNRSDGKGFDIKKHKGVWTVFSEEAIKKKCLFRRGSLDGESRLRYRSGKHENFSLPGWQKNFYMHLGGRMVIEKEVFRMFRIDSLSIILTLLKIVFEEAKTLYREMMLFF